MTIGPNFFSGAKRNGVFAAVMAEFWNKTVVDFWSA